MPFSPLKEIAQARPGKKAFIRLFAGIAAVVMFGYALLFAVSTLPQEDLRKNILQADARGFFSENFPQYAWLRTLYNRIYMYTECVGIGVALNMRPDAKTLLEMPAFGECSGLHKVVAVDNFDAAPHAYIRFIHGYQIVLKSMYTFFSLETVRAVTAGVSVLLLVFLCAALKRTTDTTYAAVVVFSFFLTSSPNMFFTVTHATSFGVALAAAAAAALGHSKDMFSIFLWRCRRNGCLLQLFTRAEFESGLAAALLYACEMGGRRIAGQRCGRGILGRCRMELWFCSALAYKMVCAFTRACADKSRTVRDHA